MTGMTLFLVLVGTGTLSWWITRALVALDGGENGRRKDRYS